MGRLQRRRGAWAIALLTLVLVCSLSGDVLADDAAVADFGKPSEPAMAAKAGGEKEVGSTGRCGVHVRVLKGWSKSKIERATPPNDAERDKIEDLKSQLETLPFARYEKVSEEQQLISFREKGVFNLKVNEAEEQILFVEPAMVTGELVAVVVDWRSGSGDELLSSKLKVGNGQNVVFGTDVSDDASLILCIKVTCE